MNTAIRTKCQHNFLYGTSSIYSHSNLYTNGRFRIISKGLDYFFFSPTKELFTSTLYGCSQIRSIDSIDWIGSSPSSAAPEWLDKTRESRAKCRSLFIGSRIPAYRTPCRSFHANPTEYFSVIPTIPKPTDRVTFLLRSSSDLTRSSSSTRQQHPLGVYSRAAGARIKLLPSLVGSEITLPADKDLTWMIVDDISLKGSSKSAAHMAWYIRNFFLATSSFVLHFSNHFWMISSIYTRSYNIL